jgi:high-affinity iron transporter
MLAVTKSVPGRSRWILLGVLSGIVGASLVAACTGFIGQLFQGSGAEAFNAIVVFSAVLMLGWHNIWMSVHGREMAKDAKKFGSQVASGQKTLASLALVVALTVLREGSEVVLFLYGILVSGQENGSMILVGGLLGLLAGAGASALLYWGIVAIPLRHFFRATSILISLLAAGLASQGIGFLQQGGFIERWSKPIWNTSQVLPETGWVGRVLHTLVGYSDQPSVLQGFAYGLTILLIFACTRYFSKRHSNLVVV